MSTDEQAQIDFEFEQLGYGSTYLIESLGTTFYMMLAIYLGHALVGLLYILAKKLKFLRRLHNWLFNKIIFGLILRFTLESYIQICISVLLNIFIVIS